MTTQARMQTVEGAKRVRVGVLGAGAIGSVVADELRAGRLPDAELVAVIGRSGGCTLGDALTLCDVIVECAGREAVIDHGIEILESGCDLVLSSVGALLDAEFAARVAVAGPGRIIATNGAIGGVDLLAAAHASGGLTSVALRSTKVPRALVRPWMDHQQRQEIMGASGEVVVFEGTAAEAARLFPASLNVAAAVDLAVDGGGRTPVTLVADPRTRLTIHEIAASGPIGNYRFTVQNEPSDANPKTSAVVPYSVLMTLTRAVAARAAPAVVNHSVT